MSDYRRRTLIGHQTRRAIVASGATLFTLFVCWASGCSSSPPGGEISARKDAASNASGDESVTPSSPESKRKLSEGPKTPDTNGAKSPLDKAPPKNDANQAPANGENVELTLPIKQPANDPDSLAVTKLPEQREQDAKEDEAAPLNPAAESSDPPANVDSDGETTKIELNPSATEPAQPAAKQPAVESPFPESPPTTTSSQPAVQKPVATQKKPENKKRTELFKGWPKPIATLVLTGRQHGYVEPCGCTGLANQKGGLARRHTFLQQLRKKGWNPIPLDMGNQVRRVGKQAEVKFQVTVNALKELKYQFVGIGPDDIRLPPGELLALIGDSDGKGPFGCANVAFFDREFFPSHGVVETAGRKFGITAVLGSEFVKSIKSDEIVVEPMKDALTKVSKAFDKSQVNFRVLLAFTSFEESRELAKKYGFDLVVTAGGAGEPAFQLEKIQGSKAVMAQVGTKSMFTTVIGIFDDPQMPIRYQRVPLDDRFADSPSMLARMKAYQEELKRLGLKGLGLKPIAHASGRKFVGSETCADCHTTAYRIWKNGPHAHATKSLTDPGERSEIKRHFDPECLSCHVTGWNPQKYFPYDSGYLSLANTKLHANGCENCHGPGSAHVDAELNGEVSDAEIARRRKAMVITKDAAKKSQCYTCHDLDNSPDFDFDKYWEVIKHYGKD